MELIVDMNTHRHAINGMTRRYVRRGLTGAHALVLMVAVKSAIQGSADHSMTRKNVTGLTVIKYIQEYRKGECTRPKVDTSKTPEISMMDIGQPITDI